MTASETTALLAAPGRAGRRWSAGTWAVVVTAALASAAVLALVLLVGPAATAGGPAAVDGHRLEQPFVGRYLHITDMHVDLQYREGSTAYSFCHRKPPQQQQQQLLSADDGHRHTGRYGFAMSKCDSPVALVNITRDYMASTWADNVDFVMWTGDSGRHDRDLDRPRTFGDIVDGNRIAAAALQSAFPRTPIVPNVGNND
ncbi:Endopolyphosphatase, partial [Coemansia biformis]